MKRYQKWLLGIALAIASIFGVRLTGLDRGLIDEVFNAVVEAFGGVDQLPEKADQRTMAEDPPFVEGPPRPPWAEEPEPVSTATVPQEK